MYDIVRALKLRFFPASRVEYVVDRLLGLINVVEAFTIPQLTQTYPRNVNQPDIYIYSVTVYTVHTALLQCRQRRRPFSASAESVPRNLPILRQPTWSGAGRLPCTGGLPRSRLAIANEQASNKHIVSLLGCKNGCVCSNRHSCSSACSAGFGIYQ